MDGTERLAHLGGRLPALVAGQLCLDFANTVEPRGGPGYVAGIDDREYLTGYDALLAWGVRAGALDEGDARRLLAAADRQPAAARAIIERAIALREAIYRVFWAVAHADAGNAPEPADLRLLERGHAEAAAHATLVRTGDRFGWTWRGDDENDGKGDGFGRVLWPVAQSATDLLTAGDLDRIKACPGVAGVGPACAWLFYDASKNRSRHWCGMSAAGAMSSACGGVAKARRQTARRRASRASKDA